MAGYGTVIDVPADTQTDENSGHDSVGPFPAGMDAVMYGSPYLIGWIHLILVGFLPQELLKTAMSIIFLHTQR